MPASAAPVFIDVQRQVASIIKDKILVGYALWEFLSVRLSIAVPSPTYGALTTAPS